MKKIVFVAVAAFFINAFADEQMLLNHPQAVVAGSVPANNPADVPLADTQNNQNLEANSTLASNSNAPTPANNGAVPAPASLETPSANAADATNLQQVSLNDTNNTQQNPDNQGAGAVETDCSTVSFDQCNGRCKLLTNYTNNTKQCVSQ